MSQRRITIGIALAVVAVAVIALYAQKLGNRFVFDDYAFVIGSGEQADIRNIPGFFTTDQHRLYRPLRSTAYTLVRHFFGLSPVAHQTAGLLFHLAVTLAFTLIVYQLSASPRMAMIAGLIAGLHPVHCDRAVPVTGSFDLLGLAFGYGALAAFLAWARNKNRSAFIGGILLLLLGLLSSEEAATIPLLLVLFRMAMPKEEGSGRRYGAAIMSAFALLVVYLFLRSAFVPEVARVKGYAAGGLFETLLTMAVVFWRYIGLAVFPFGLAPEHDVAIYQTISFTPILDLIGLVILAVLAFLVRKTRPLVFVGIGWFFIGLAPFSNIIPLDTLLAERYFYAGLFGFALILARGIDLLIDNTSDAKRVIVVVCTVTILILYFILSSTRIVIWHDDRSLWKDALEKEPRTYLANLNFANVLHSEGDKEGAMGYWQTAAKIKPDGFEVYVAFGNARMEEGDYGGAKEQYLTALRHKEGHLPALEGLLQAELALGKTDLAFRMAADLLKENPNNLVSLNVVGYILARSGHCDRAIPILKKLVALAEKEDLQKAALQNLEYCESKQAEVSE
jgi:tetratricopeptide (TPR) repeat protein